VLNSKEKEKMINRLKKMKNELGYQRMIHHNHQKYKKIKFFEMKKIKRGLKKVEK